MRSTRRIRLVLLLGALAMMPALAADQMQYGRAYLAEGDHAAAVQSYSEVVRMNPFDPVAQNNLAVARAANGDYQTAIDLLTRAVKLAPGRADIRENLTNLQGWMANSGGVGLSIAVPAQPRLAQQGGAAVLPEPPPLWGRPGAAAPGAAALRTSAPVLPLPTSTRR